MSRFLHGMCNCRPLNNMQIKLPDATGDTLGDSLGCTAAASVLRKYSNVT